MRPILVIASDYDGTLAKNGVLSQDTVQALQSFRAKGGILIMVTGRHMRDLRGEGCPPMTPHMKLFDVVVAENGAIIWVPATDTEFRLSRAIPTDWRNTLRTALPEMVEGREVLSIPIAYELKLHDLLRKNNIHLKIEKNLGSIMLTMPGVDKAAGLRRAVRMLHVSLDDVVGMGDAENDVAFLKICGTSVAVANALPEVKKIADIITTGSDGKGVQEVIAALTGNGLQKSRFVA